MVETDINRENRLQRESIEKIKRKCLLIQEVNLADQIKNIENENNKSWLIIGFIGALIAIISANIWDISNIEKITLIILFVTPMWLSLYNVSSKKVKSHIWINSYFVNRPDQYEGFLNDIHMRLNDNYIDISRLLDQKVWLTNLAYFFTILLLVFILFIKLF